MEIQFILPVPGHREWRLQSGILDPITRLRLGCVALGKLLLISQAFLNKAVTWATFGGGCGTEVGTRGSRSGSSHQVRLTGTVPAPRGYTACGSRGTAR